MEGLDDDRKKPLSKLSFVGVETASVQVGRSYGVWRDWEFLVELSDTDVPCSRIPNRTPRLIEFVQRTIHVVTAVDVGA